MTTEPRDALAQIVYQVNNPKCGDYGSHQETADAILADGWRPPAEDTDDDLPFGQWAEQTMRRVLDRIQQLRVSSAGAGHGLGRQPSPLPDSETETEHVIEFREDGWTIKHPLACRPNLFDCAVNRAAGRALREPPAEFGRFACGLAEDGQFVVGDRRAVTS